MPQIKSDKKRVTVRLAYGNYDELEKEALKLGISVNSLISMKLVKEKEKKE